MHAWKWEDYKDLKNSLKLIYKRAPYFGEGKQKEECSTCFLLRDRECLSGKEFLFLV